MNQMIEMVFLIRVIYEQQIIFMRFVQVIDIPEEYQLKGQH